MNIAIATPPEESTSIVTRNRIVGFVNDELSAAALRKGLEGANLSIRRGTIRNAIRMLETDTDLFALVADISGIDDPFTELERLSGVCPPDVRVAVIGDNREITFYRELLELGLTEYLPRPLTRDMVLDKLRPKLLGDVAANHIDRGGHVVSICGAQGGAGATSIAINLALQLAETTKAKVALLDLHLQGGEAAVMLGVRPGPGLRIALENPMRADTLFLERAAIEVNERVCLVSADEDLDAQLEITEAGIRHVLGLLRQRFNYIVVDVPVPFPPSIYPVIKLSRHVMVLLESEVTGLRNAHALRAAVINIAGKDRVFTLLNRAGRPGGLPRAAVVKALGAEPDIVIPDLGKGMTEALNLGIPALKHVRKLRRHLAPIVREISGVAAERSGWWRRVLTARLR
ncbi:AAA family ATPase [Bradyrhizobium canariense]|uniref:Pilus assembly protein CpaE n=1 Tax=Bradyrhizobium canariense TaxID=255045 RepID=A0A1X3GGI1_9BRAD|nr:pilus assembly protein CpaE [Bradyrhizobium canariense]OSI63064.1 pilus assembly protein CpaE [Bradyrhizobium canariense]OSI72502.1 pilus assembly protein CpaE [Bradyrhizobium canariense]OSI83474.1 pilus assembly protein CpaE [Bradyrhizobium canariense]OSI88777.1 pilus assembly protein CpaE [Bradyrhizobium canariense]OSI97075.1 pilus assembly protein CpaE [Bradyrhizobium canariense]